MDSLLAEINKRKAEDFADDRNGSGSSAAKKYMRRADIERQREEQLRAKQEEERRMKVAAEEAKAATRSTRMKKEAESARLASLARLAASPTPDVSTPEPESDGGTPDNTGANDPSEKPLQREAFNISPEECVRRLRAKGQPIRLFGETDKERRLRLRALELLGERGTAGGQQNDFKRALEEMQKLEGEKEARGGAAGVGSGVGAGIKGKVDDKKRTDLEVLDLGLIKTDFNKLHPLIYWALKNVLKEWEEWLDNRPADVKRTAQGKLAAANQVQSAHNMKPLFKQLRQRDLPESVVRHLAEIVHHMQKREYQKANDAYLRLAIGNAAWPIGVTSVGIHERSAREKITDNVGHVLNDEVSRKYIQAVKRLLTFAQTVRPPDDVAQMMG